MENYEVFAVLGCGKSAEAAGALLNRNDIRYEQYHDLDSLIKSGYEFDCLVTSPGIELPEDAAAAMSTKKIRIISELELGYRYCTPPAGDNLFAVTGTNGKSTTVTLLSEIVKNSGYSVELLGNIGVPFSSYNGAERAVLEVSSFMLEYTDTFRPHIAAILNIAPDHLNRHKTIKNYAEIKKRIFKMQTEFDFAVLNRDDPWLDNVACKSKKYGFSLNKRCRGAYIRDGHLYFMKDKIIHAKFLRIPGMHNIANCLAAACMARLADISPDIIADSIHDFRGIPHRIQFIRRIRDIDFYNDSKATNCQSAITAIRSLQGRSIVILGGSDKGEDYAELFSTIAETGGLAVITGATAEAMSDCAVIACAKYITAYNFEAAVAIAYNEALKDPMPILLSPACASYDRFKNFEHRGEYFAALVNSL